MAPQHAPPAGPWLLLAATCLLACGCGADGSPVSVVQMNLAYPGAGPEECADMARALDTALGSHTGTFRDVIYDARFGGLTVYLVPAGRADEAAVRQARRLLQEALPELPAAVEIGSVTTARLRLPEDGVRQEPHVLIHLRRPVRMTGPGADTEYDIAPAGMDVATTLQVPKAALRDAGSPDARTFVAEKLAGKVELVGGPLTMEDVVAIEERPVTTRIVARRAP